jgi:hypothetical protein
MVDIKSRDVNRKIIATSSLYALESAKLMSPKDERIGLRVSGEVKSALAQIAKKEGRSLAQISELFLKAGIHAYAKEGPDYLRPLLDHPAQEILVSKRAPRRAKTSGGD